MEITWALVFATFACFFSLLTNHKILFYLVIFFFSFTATVVINFTNGQGISLFLFISMFISILLLFSLLKDFAHKRIIFSRYSIMPIQFGLIVLISIFMPIWIDGSLEVDSNMIFEDYYKIPIYFSFDTILAVMPVMIGVMLVLSILRFVDNEVFFFKLSRYLILSIVFVAFWGIFQFICNIVPFINYPDFIFNNIKSETARGFAQVLESDDVSSSFARLSSVTHEPSTFVKHLLIPIPILYLSKVTGVIIFSRKFDSFILYLLIGMIILSTSTTGLIGLILCFIITNLFLSFFYNQRIFLRLIFFLIFLTTFFAIALVAIPDYLQLILFDKLASGSGIERISSIINSWQYFLMYPIYGVGWNNVTVNDLIVNLLVNSGLIGLSSFMILLLFSIRWPINDLNFLLKNNIIKNSDFIEIQNHLCGYMISFITLVILGIFTGIEFYLGYFYIVLSMVYASGNIISRINTYNLGEMNYERMQ